MPRGRTEQILAWYRSWSTAVKTIFQAGFAIVVFYGGALLEQEIQGRFAEDSPGVFLVRTFAIVALLLVFCSIGIAFRTRMDVLEQREYVRHRQLRYAWSLMDQYVSMQIETVHSEGGRDKQDAREFIESVSTSPQRLGNIIRETYRFFESQYASVDSASSSILDFEVTFMVRSYVDGKLTIPAYANRQGRAPPSLEQRKTDGSLYEKTVAAQMFKETRPTMRIVHDTVADSAFMDLYPSQRSRIRSLLVFPVLSDMNKVLGALIVHCNKPGIFNESERDFWNELLEIFGKRLALEKSRLDKVMRADFQTELGVSWPPPF